MLERPLPIHPGEPLHLRLLLNGTNLVVYANNQVALSCRMYDHRAGDWGVFATEGKVHFSGMQVRTR